MTFSAAVSLSANWRVPLSQMSPVDRFLSTHVGPQSKSTTSSSAIGGQASNGIQPMSRPPWF